MASLHFRSVVPTAALGLFTAASSLHAQCADGSPPPCQQARRVASAAPAPAINPREWIVVPFNNVTRAQDVEWLREASVNLLTLEIGRWTDVQVVNDKRVGDLLRELPAERRNQALTLSDGLELARRAGSGMLVMGDFIKLGKGARLSANVFDVRTGARIRTAEQRLADADSILAAFGPLSRAVLAVPPPPDARSGEIGTQKLDAYQAYLRGVRFLNHWDLEGAERELSRALAIDSTFALAHLYMAFKLGWTDPLGERSVRHALAAQRLGTALPARERALIDVNLHLVREENDEACRLASPLVARDSSDVLALWLMGECAFHDNTVLLPAHDTLPGSWKWGWNTSLATMRRALQLDPSFHMAFQHVLDILRSTVFPGCGRPTPTSPCESWRGVVLLDGDTLLVQPLSPRNADGMARQRNRAQDQRPFVASLAMAQRIAQAWAAADTANDQAQIALAMVAQSQGDIARADRHYRRVSDRRLMSGDPVEMLERMDVALKLGDSVTVHLWSDRLAKAAENPGNPPAWKPSIDLTFARAAMLRSRIDSVARRTQVAAPDAAAAYAQALPRVLMGLPVADIAQLERAYLASMRDTASCRGNCLGYRVIGTLALVPDADRGPLPALEGVTELWYLPAKAYAARDSSALRVAAQRLDSSSRARVAMLWPDDLNAISAGNAFLALGDSVNALRMYRFAVDSAMVLQPINRNMGGGLLGMNAVAAYPAAWLRRARLAAALGHVDEARKAYDRVLALWARPDPEFEPDVARIRAARAALGSGVP